jgi:hypothetical protein
MRTINNANPCDERNAGMERFETQMENSGMTRLVMGGSKTFAGNYAATIKAPVDSSNRPLQSSGRFCFKPGQRLEKMVVLMGPYVGLGWRGE